MCILPTIPDPELSFYIHTKWVQWCFPLNGPQVLLILLLFMALPPPSRAQRVTMEPGIQQLGQLELLRIIPLSLLLMPLLLGAIIRVRKPILLTTSFCSAAKRQILALKSPQKMALEKLVTFPQHPCWFLWCLEHFLISFKRLESEVVYPFVYLIRSTFCSISMNKYHWTYGKNAPSYCYIYIKIQFQSWIFGETYS